MSEIFKESDFIPRYIPKLHIVRFGVLGSFDAVNTHIQKIHSYYVTIKEGGGQRFSSGLYYEKHLNFCYEKKRPSKGSRKSNFSIA